MFKPGISIKNESDKTLVYVMRRNAINGLKVLDEPKPQKLEPGQSDLVNGTDAMTFEFMAAE